MPRGQRQLGRGVAGAWGVCGTPVAARACQRIFLLLIAERLDQAEMGAPEGGEEDYRSSMSLLRGTVYDAMDDRERAIEVRPI